MSNKYERFQNEGGEQPNMPPPPPYEQVGTQQQYGHPPPTGQQQYGYPPPGQQPYGNPPPHAPPPGQQHMPAGQQPVVTQQNVVVTVVGNCPNCRVGRLRESFNICGIILAVLCFPLGLLFLLCMVDKKCDNCGFLE